MKVLPRPYTPYTAVEFYTYYYAWSNASRNGREDQWNEYCDVRDSVPLGSNKFRCINGHFPWGERMQVFQ